jgi:hypothetical protein
MFAVALAAPVASTAPAAANALGSIAYSTHADAFAVKSPGLSARPTYTCFDDGTSGKRVQALYIYKTVNDLPVVLPQLQEILGEVSSVIDPTGTVHVRYVHDSDCMPTVTALQTGGLKTFARMMQHLADAGYNDPNRKYIVFTQSTVYCGIATVVKDSAPGADNKNNTGGGYARIDKACWSPMVTTHELAHTLGAVQPDAPHATAYWHCTDEADVMCYHDGPGSVMRSRCPLEAFDCNNDDYFSLNPTGYLTSHWNVANSSFLG